MAAYQELITTFPTNLQSAPATGQSRTDTDINMEDVLPIGFQKGTFLEGICSHST